MNRHLEILNNSFQPFLKSTVYKYQTRAENLFIAVLFFSPKNRSYATFARSKFNYNKIKKHGKIRDNLYLPWAASNVYSNTQNETFRYVLMTIDLFEFINRLAERVPAVF